MQHTLCVLYALPNTLLLIGLSLFADFADKYWPNNIRVSLTHPRLPDHELHSVMMS